MVSVQADDNRRLHFSPSKRAELWLYYVKGRDFLQLLASGGLGPANRFWKFSNFPFGFFFFFLFVSGEAGT